MWNSEVARRRSAARFLVGGSACQSEAAVRFESSCAVTVEALAHELPRDARRPPAGPSSSSPRWNDPSSAASRVSPSGSSMLMHFTPSSAHAARKASRPCVPSPAATVTCASKVPGRGAPAQGARRARGTAAARMFTTYALASHLAERAVVPSGTQSRSHPKLPVPARRGEEPTGDASREELDVRRLGRLRERDDDARDARANRRSARQSPPRRAPATRA